MSKSKLSQELENINSSLNEKTNQTIYDVAVREISQNKYNFSKLNNIISNNKAIKVAVTADSITEGWNNYIDDIWFSNFIRELKLKLKNITVNSQNFALAGRQIMYFNDDNYKGLSSEPSDLSTGFYRSWSTVGKSWKQHILDYAPDILFIAFGMNDTKDLNSDYKWYQQMNTLISWLNTNLPNCVSVIVPTIMPTENKILYNQSSVRTKQIARTAREYAKNNNIALVDAHRLYSILRYGYDEERFTPIEYTNISDITALTDVYNFDMNISIATWSLNTNNPVDITFRIGDDGGLLFRFYLHDSGVKKIDVYSMEYGSGTYLTSFNAIEGINNIKIVGSNIYVNNNKYTLYKHLRDGNITIANSSKINSINFIKRDFITEVTKFTEIDLLGKVQSSNVIGTSGSGTNHPTALTHYLAYCQGYKGVLNSIEANFEKFNLTLQNGWTMNGSLTPYIIYKNGFGYLYGQIKAGTKTANTNLAYLPNSVTVHNDVVINAITDVGFTWVKITGNTIQLAKALGTDTVIVLDGISFPIN